MVIVHTINELKVLLDVGRQAGQAIGFVPTMGALHDGHLSLVKRCKLDNNVCVVSIFINPTQFNDKNDLQSYPQTLKKDCEKLMTIGCNFVFVPSEDEMYPEPDTRIFNFGAIEEVMEGACRPGHFMGVAQIVSKLFEVVEPDNAYFGEKDFQQIAIVQSMIKQLGMRVNLIACPIIRDDDGLAMSSRNSRLTSEQRHFAPAIAHTLKESLTFASSNTIKGVKAWVTKSLNDTPFMRVEYFEIIDGNTLQPIDAWNDSDYPVGCISVYCGEVRLIDNIKYEFQI